MNLFFFFFFKEVRKDTPLKKITLRMCCEDRKTLMKINVSEIWNTYPALRYFRSRAVVLYVALLITRWFYGQNKKGIYRE